MTAWLAFAPSPSPTPGDTIGGAPTLMYIIGGVLFILLLAGVLLVSVFRSDPGRPGSHGGGNLWN